MGDAVGRALNNDPVYLGAQADLGISKAQSSQAFAALMPKLSASVSTTKNRRDYFQTPIGGTPSNILETYNSDSAQLNLTQPLWHLDNYYGMRQADYVVEQSDQKLLSAGQDLLVRLAQTWFDILQARDALSLGESKLSLAKYQLDQAVKSNEKGAMSITDKELAHGKYELARAEQNGAEAALRAKFAALEEIIGPLEKEELPDVSGDIAIPEHGDSSLKYWLKLVGEHNPSIWAARYALDAANEEVHKQYAGHEPTLDIVASYGKSSQGAGLTGGQAGFSAKTNSVGLQLNVPLFAGGGQVAKVREADAKKEKTMEDLKLAERNARLSTKQAWFMWLSSETMQMAARQNMRSTAFALKGAEAERARGIGSELDVLKAKVEFDGATRDFRKAQYDSFLAYFKLLAMAGRLTGNDLMRLDHLTRMRR